MHKLRLQTIYWLAGLAMALGCLLLGGIIFLGNLQEYKRYERNAARLTSFHASQVLISRLSTERGTINSALSVAPAANGAAGSLTTARTLSDQALASLEAALAKDAPPSGRMAGLLWRVRQHLDNARKSLDAYTAADPAGPQHDLALLASEDLFQASDAAAALRDHIGRAIIDDIPLIGADILLCSISSDIRDQAGRVRSYVSMMLAFPPHARANLDRRLAAVEGRLEGMRNIMLDYSDSERVPASVQGALDQVQHEYFGQTLRYANQMRLDSLGEAGTIDPGEFNRRYLSGLTPLETLRQLFTQSLERRLNEARDQAGRMLVTSGAITLLVFAVMGLISLALHRLLFRPLVTASEQIAAMAGGDFSTPVPDTQISPELRKTFESLQVLRENQKRKQAMERDQQRMNTQLQYLSQTDALSGMLNRRALEGVAHRLIAESDTSGQRVGLIVFDIDHFKSINDTYGHGVGDQVIQRIGKTLHPMLRSRDTLARFGGEEFVVLIPNTSKHELRLVAERLRKTLSVLPVSSEQPSRTISASFGIAVREPGTLTWDAFFMVADRRLYMAKRLGRNQVCAEDPEPHAPAGQQPLAADAAAAC